MTVRPCHAPEPPIAELLDDSVLHALMRRDRVSRRALEELIAATQKRLGPHPRPAAVPRAAVQDVLFAECGA